jgi:hypothetical protein
MSQAVITGKYDKVTYPSAANGTKSRPFAVPRGAKSAVIFAPATGGNWDIQAVPPPDSDQVTLTSQALSYIAQPTAAGAAILVTLTGFAASSAVAIDAHLLGGGIFMFSSAAVSTIDSLTFLISWNIDDPEGM